MENKFYTKEVILNTFIFLSLLFLYFMDRDTDLLLTIIICSVISIYFIVSNVIIYLTYKERLSDCRIWLKIINLMFIMMVLSIMLLELNDYLRVGTILMVYIILAVTEKTYNNLMIKNAKEFASEIIKNTLKSTGIEDNIDDSTTAGNIIKNYLTKFNGKEEKEDKENKED